jgi:hypothetical protein
MENDDENIFEDEYEAKDRSGKGDMLTHYLRNLKFRDQNPEEQFITILNAVFNKLLELDTKIVHESGREQIMSTVSKLKEAHLKNAPCYILGYYSIGPGNTLSVDRLNKIFEELPSITSLSTVYPVFKITKADVLRYARLWQNLLRR